MIFVCARHFCLSSAGDDPWNYGPVDLAILVAEQVWGAGASDCAETRAGFQSTSDLEGSVLTLMLLSNSGRREDEGVCHSPLLSARSWRMERTSRSVSRGKQPKSAKRSIKVNIIAVTSRVNIIAGWWSALSYSFPYLQSNGRRHITSIFRY